MTLEDLEKGLAYILSESEEKEVPTRAELRERYKTRIGVTVDNFEDTVFSVDEFKILEKGRDAALAKIDELTARFPELDFCDIRDLVWSKCFRSSNFADVAAYPIRVRIYSNPF